MSPVLFAGLVSLLRAVVLVSLWSRICLPADIRTRNNKQDLRNMADVSRVGPPLGQAAGYGIILGLGFAFALGMIGTTWALKRYHNEVQTSEAFSTAGRSVKSGLVASAVVSSWTWAATLLQSSGVAYRYGVSGPFWYASVS